LSAESCRRTLAAAGLLGGVPAVEVVVHLLPGDARRLGAVEAAQEAFDRRQVLPTGALSEPLTGQTGTVRLDQYHGVSIHLLIISVQFLSIFVVVTAVF
jgi:hypothetical protein